MGAPHTRKVKHETPNSVARRGAYSRTVAATVPGGSGVVTHAGNAAARIRFTAAISAQEASAPGAGTCTR